MADPGLDHAQLEDAKEGRRADDPELYRDAYEEAQRIIRISDEVRISMERVASMDAPTDKSESGT